MEAKRSCLEKSMRAVFLARIPQCKFGLRSRKYKKLLQNSFEKIRGEIILIIRTE